MSEAAAIVPVQIQDKGYVLFLIEKEADCGSLTPAPSIVKRLPFPVWVKWPKQPIPPDGLCGFGCGCREGWQVHPESANQLRQPVGYATSATCWTCDCAGRIIE